MTDPQENPRPHRAKLSFLAVLALLFALAAIFLSLLVSVEISYDYVSFYAVPLFLAWLPLLLALAGAVVLGLMGARRVDSSQGRLKGATLGVTAVGIAIICGVLTAPVAVSSIRRLYIEIQARRSWRYTKPIRTLGAAMQAYARDHNSYPDPNKWSDELVRLGYVHNASPDGLGAMVQKRRWPCGMNPHCRADSPDDIVLLFETEPSWNHNGGRESLVQVPVHPEDGCFLVLFNSGRAQFIRSTKLWRLKWH